MKVTFLRQRHSLKKVNQQIKDITESLSQMDVYLGKEEEAELLIRNVLYGNVTIAFGKYKRKMNNKRQNMRIKLEKMK